MTGKGDGSAAFSSATPRDMIRLKALPRRTATDLHRRETMYDNI